MKKVKIQECLYLTEHILVEHFIGEHKELYELLSDDCLWIGACSDEYYLGKEKVIEVIESEKTQIPKIYLSSREFQCASSDRNSCVIVGRYIGMTDESSGEIFRDMQRVTFVWKEKQGSLSIVHMHVSNPLNNIEENETFPHGVGIYTKEYLDMLIQKEIEKKGVISIKDQSNAIHNVYIANILYMEAFNTTTLVHTINGDILSRILLSELERKIKEIDPNIIIRVHKSFAVNRFYVERIERYELLVDGKHRVPVSKNNYLEVKEKLHMSIEESG